MVVIIHGGFWKNHVGLEIMDNLANMITLNGFATWNIEYRRVGDAGGGYPGTFFDCENAVDYINTLCKSYPLDPDRVIIIGHSAGGHLALWLAGRKKSSPSSIIGKTSPSVSIRGVISLAGVSDLEMMYHIHRLQEINTQTRYNPTRDFIGGSPEEFSQRYKEASPIHLLPIDIPSVLIHGNLDINVPIGISSQFEKMASQAGDNVYLEEISHAEHFKVIDPDSEIKQVILSHVKKLSNEN